MASEGVAGRSGRGPELWVGLVTFLYVWVLSTTTTTTLDLRLVGELEGCARISPIEQLFSVYNDL